MIKLLHFRYVCVIGEARIQSPKADDRGSKRKLEPCHDEKEVEEKKWEEKKVCKGF